MDEPLDPPSLVRQRRTRLDAVLAAHGESALLTGDPFGIRYATGSRNMTVHGLTGPDRFALVIAGGPAILWEFAGCEHLSRGLVGVDEVREAPGVSAKKSLCYRDDVVRFADEIVGLVDHHGSRDLPLAIDRIDVAVVDALRERGIAVTDGTLPMQLAMAVKQPAELDAMRAAMAATEEATHAVRRAIEPGRTEQEVWSEFHRALIAAGGEFVVARLLQAGRRTFPYFREASGHVLADGDLVCFDTDAVGSHGYSVDFSRTFACGSSEPTRRQRDLFALAEEQLDHNAANLAAGLPFEEFARRAFEVPEPYERYGYYQLAHGLGLAGGHPNVPRVGDGPYPLPGAIEPGMVLCVESYIGDPDTQQGVKLEDQFLVHADRIETMSTFPLDERLRGRGIDEPTPRG